MRGRRSRGPSLLGHLAAGLAAAVWVLGAGPAWLARALAGALWQVVAFFAPTGRRPRGRPPPLRRPPRGPQRGEWRLRALALAASLFVVIALVWRPSPSAAQSTDDALLVPLPPPSPGADDGDDPFARLPPLPAPPVPLPPQPDLAPSPTPTPDPAPGPAPAPGPPASCGRPARALDVAMAWSDHNGVVAGHLQCELVVDRGALAAAIDAYGLPDSYLQLWSAPTAAERFRSRGIRFVERGGVYVWGTDYREMVRRAGGDLRCLARQLAGTLDAAGATAKRTRLGTLASFVQAIAYPADKDEPIPPQRTLSDGTTVRTAGFRVPLETLALREGDCDSKSTLFSGLVAALGGPRTVLVTGEGHQFGGVELPPRQGERYVEVGGRVFVLIEFTANLPLGTIAEDSWRHVRRGVLELIVP